MPSTLRVQLQLRIVSDDDTVIRDEVILQLDKSSDRLETVGLCLEDSKGLLGRLQHAVVEAQAGGLRQPASLLLRLRTPSARQGAVPDRLPHRVWQCCARKLTLLPLPVSPGGQHDLQPLG
jgi:hypothetical protein